jgi:hypothetical protein
MEANEKRAENNPAQTLEQLVSQFPIACAVAKGRLLYYRKTQTSVL